MSRIKQSATTMMEEKLYSLIIAVGIVHVWVIHIIYLVFSLTALVSLGKTVTNTSIDLYFTLKESDTFYRNETTEAYFVDTIHGGMFTFFLQCIFVYTMLILSGIVCMYTIENRLCINSLEYCGKPYVFFAGIISPLLTFVVSLCLLPDALTTEGTFIHVFPWATICAWLYIFCPIVFIFYYELCGFGIVMLGNCIKRQLNLPKDTTVNDTKCSKTLDTVE